jgi:hypothetical protein
MEPVCRTKAAGIVQSFRAEGIARGTLENTVGTGSFDIGIKGRLLVWLSEPPPKIRLIAPRKVCPPGGRMLDHFYCMAPV